MNVSANLGVNEQEAKEKKIPYEVTRYGIGDLDRRAVATGPTHTHALTCLALSAERRALAAVVRRASRADGSNRPSGRWHSADDGGGPRR